MHKNGCLRQFPESTFSPVAGLYLFFQQPGPPQGHTDIWPRLTTTSKPDLQATYPWTPGWLPGPYIQASPGLISNFTISPQATSACRAPAVFIASAHCPQGHLQLRTKALSLAWGGRGKIVVLQAVLQKDSRGRSVLLTFQGHWFCASFPFPEILPEVRTLLYSAPEPLQERWKHRGLQKVLHWKLYTVHDKPTVRAGRTYRRTIATRHIFKATHYMYFQLAYI